MIYVVNTSFSYQNMDPTLKCPFPSTSSDRKFPSSTPSPHTSNACITITASVASLAQNETTFLHSNRSNNPYEFPVDWLTMTRKSVSEPLLLLSTSGP